MLSWFFQLATQWRIAGGHFLEHKLLGLLTADTTHNVAVGAASPMAAVTSGASNTAVGSGALANVTSGSNNFAVGKDSGTDAVANLSSASNTGVLGNNATTTIYAKVSVTATSDQRDKTTFQDLPWTRDMFMMLSPGQFQFKDRATGQINGTLRYGFSAQNLLAIETQFGARRAVLVDCLDQHNLKFNEAMMTPILVQQMQRMQREIDQLKEALLAQG